MIDEQAWLAMWNKPEVDAIRELSTDDLEVTAVTAAIDPRHYRGKDAAVQWLSDLRKRLQADWTATKLTVLAEDALITEGELRFIDPTATTGAESQTFAILMRLRDGKLCWIGTFVTFHAAHEAWEIGIGAQ